MEVPEMESKTESHATSVAAFVEGGIQEACDDACSICLEDFCKSDPANVTNCKHEFHLQCILEWCQRSSQCPMCWQTISLKDATSQELLEAVEQERTTRSRNATIFHHPILGGFELQQLPVGVNDGDLEQRIIQHLAAAAAMRRTHHRGHRTRSSAHGHGHPHLLVFSAEPSAPDSAVEGGNEPATSPVGSESSPSQQIPYVQNQSSSLTPGPAVVTITNLHSDDRESTTRSSPSDQDSEGPSELQSFSDSLRSRLNAVSMRYKESISKGTRGWKERLFSRSSSMSEIGSQVRRELNAGIASASRLMERLETRQNNPPTAMATLSDHLMDCHIAETSNQNNVEARGDNSLHANNTPATCSASSNSN